MSYDVEEKRGGLRIRDGVAIVVVGVVGVIVAFAVFHFVVGLIWEAVKVAVVLAVIFGVLFFLMGRRRRG